jgi:iron complex transport system substrate-binding protein
MNTDALSNNYGRHEFPVRLREASSIRDLRAPVKHLCSSVFICGFTAFFFTPSVHASISLTDDVGRQVTLQAPARRIVTLAPFLTELVFAAGAGDRVVGVSAYSDYPEQARKLPVVSSAAGVSLEQVAALKPDLLLAWRDSFRPEWGERLASFGIAVFIASGRRLDDVPRLLKVIDNAAGVDSSKVRERFDAEVASLRASYAQKRRVDAFLEVWHRPLTTISGQHFMNDALELCGAGNLFKERAGVARQVSWEEVYRVDPYVVIGTGSASTESEFRANWKARPTLAAVKADRLVWIDADTIQRPTTRTPQGIRQLCERLDAVRSLGRSAMLFDLRATGLQKGRAR